MSDYEITPKTNLKSLEFCADSANKIAVLRFHMQDGNIVQVCAQSSAVLDMIDMLKQLHKSFEH